MRSVVDKLSHIVARCKGSVRIEVNPHRDVYESTADRLAQILRQECPPEISQEVQAKILEADSIVELQFYPDTPIGFYCVCSYSIEAALDEALECLTEQDESA